MMNRLGCKPFFVAAALWMVGCGDETTVNEMAGVPELASGAALPACTEDNAGELLYAADSGLIYLCQNAEWIPLGNAEYGTDTLVIRDTLFFSSVDTLILRDTLVGLNGTSCTAEALADGSGYKVLCGGDSVGVVKNGRDGNAAVDTLFLSTRDTLVVSNVDTLVLKDTLIVKDTLVLSNRDTLVIIDTVFCIQKPQASSSSAAQSSSSSAVNISTSEFVTWVGANSDYRVETGFDDGTDTYGYWYELSDNTETDDGGPGASSITWPVRKGNAYSDDAMDPIIEHCDGLCGRATLAGPYTYPYVGLAFNISGSDKYGVDISGWDGICVEYKSTEIRPSLVIVPENNSSVTGGNDYKVLMPIAASETVVNFAWSDFKQEAGWGTIVDRSAVLSKAATVWIKFAGVDGRTTDFNIAKIGRYGQCGTGSQASSSSAAQPSSSSTEDGFETWVGANSEYRVETGFDDGTDTYGYWYEELVDGGTIAWPVTKGNAYSDDAMDPIIDYCGGICGVAAGTGSNPSVYFGFNISGSDRRGVDISGWNGICVKYKSTGIGPRLLIVPSSEISTGYDDYAASLPIAASETVVNLAWSDFTQGGWGTAVNRSAVLAKAAAIKFHFNTSLGRSADFNIAKIGRYGQCGD